MDHMIILVRWSSWIKVMNRMDHIEQMGYIDQINGSHGSYLTDGVNGSKTRSRGSY